LGKTRRGHKEFSNEQRLKVENQKLRRENSRLRKQLARIDLDRYTHVRDIVEEHLANEEEVDADRLLEALKSKWRCLADKCVDGYLEIIVYSKMNQEWYFRQCNKCDNRTKSQVYSPNVEGIKKEIPLEPEKVGVKSKNK
jgi:hypothetical protein